jgi:hypothetical protein
MDVHVASIFRNEEQAEWLSFRLCCATFRVSAVRTLDPPQKIFNIVKGPKSQVKILILGDLRSYFVFNFAV